MTEWPNSNGRVLPFVAVPFFMDTPVSAVKRRDVAPLMRSVVLGALLKVASWQ